MSEPAPPPDARELHRYVDVPRHVRFVVAGWLIFAVCFLAATVNLMILAAPSDPCSPGASECGPDHRTLAIRVAVFFGLAALSVLWSVGWHLRDQRYRFQVPPGWPQPPSGWEPWRGWSPLSSWPAPPDGWKYWR